MPSALQLAQVDDADPVAQPLGLLHVVRRVEHRHALPRRVARRSRGSRCGSADRRRRSARRGSAAAAGAAARCRCSAAAACRPRSSSVCSRARSVSPMTSSTSSTRRRASAPAGRTAGAKKRRFSPRAQVRVERELLRHVADRRLGRDAARGRAVVPATDLAGVRLEQPADHRDRGRLAGAVRAEQPVGLPLRDREADAAHGLELAEALAQTAALEHRRRHQRRAARALLDYQRAALHATDRTARPGARHPRSARSKGGSFPQSVR